MKRIAILLAVALVAFGAARGESAMEELRAIRKSAEDAIVEIEAPTPEPSGEPEQTAAPTPAPSYESIEPGSKGDAVVKLQKELIALGFLDGSADGSYGPMTRRAVEKFQRSEGLEATGAADSDTQAALFAADAPETASYEKLNYAELARDPDARKGTRLSFSGVVMQVLTDDADDPRGVYTVMRVATRQRCYDVLYVSGFRPASARALTEWDEITVNGLCLGGKTYTGAAGRSVTLPWIEIESIR